MKTLNRIIDGALASILALMALAMAVNVFCRFVLKSPLSWADELSQSLMVWLTFIGAAAVLRDGTHYAFTYLDTVFSGKMKIIYEKVSQVLVLLAICLLLYWSIPVTLGIVSWSMPAMGISKVFVYGACPVGCILMLVYAVYGLIKG